MATIKILITGDDEHIAQSKVKPEEGMFYNLEPTGKGTLSQNSAFHALVMEFWRWGGHPKYGGDPFSVFRDKIKRDLGTGFAAYVYADISGGKPRIFQVDNFEAIPEHVRSDSDRATLIQGKLKSWIDYTKKERQQTIDNLLDDIRACGCNTPKMDMIIEGMQDETG